MKIRKKYLFYVLAFSSSITAAIISAIDAYIHKSFIPNPLALGFAFFIVGVIISLLIILVLSLPIKGKSLGNRLIDPSFKRIRLVKKEELKYHILAGFGNTLLTISYVFMISLFEGDPSTVLPFSQIAILYLVVIESVAEKNMPTIVEIQSSVIVTFGAILGSISLTGEITLESMTIVFLFMCPAWVLFSIYQRKLKLLRINDSPNDSLNIRFWNVAFAFFFTAVIFLLYDFFIGTENFLAGFNVSFEFFGWLALSMGVTFFSYVFYIRALGIGKASVTQAVRASIVIFTIPLSLLLYHLGVISTTFLGDPVSILLKIMGTILLILGIVTFALTLVKAYIFIKVKPGYPVEETMQKIWDIRGVTRVTAVAGHYDYIVKIRTRTLIKGYERILRKIQEIEAIKEYKWQSVLKEWENI